ncbi:MAG: Ig-like domain-containing protein, partial [Mucilaginibacter sp.]
VAIYISNGNIAPAVSLTSPLAGSEFTAPASVIITAQANDADGSVAKVEFFSGNTLLGTANTSPYTFSWDNVAAGNYTLTAKATDDGGAITSSAAIAISVVTIPLLPPVVNIVTPVNNATFAEPATITISALASDDGSISKVELFNGSTLLNTQFTSPYTFTWQNVPAGNYTLTAVATDNDGLKTTSDVVAVSVTGTAVPIPPVVTLMAPVATPLTAPATIGITAAASDADGSITKVEFFNGTTLLQSVTAPPYTFSWKNVSAGTYSIKARATDDDGLQTTSLASIVSVSSAGQGSQAPTVSITAPLDNSTYAAQATIPLVAIAGDANGTITKVQFFNGSTLLKTELNSPYENSWKNAPAGNYTITAKATDNSGLVTTSAPIHIKVGAVKAAKSESSQASRGSSSATESVSVSSKYNSKASHRKSDMPADLSNVANFRLFPNPAVTAIQVYFEGLQTYQKANLIIYNIQGAIIKEYPVVLSGNNINVDISALSAGVYIVGLSNNSFSVNKKFTKIN